MKKIEITVCPKGKVSLTTKGFSGNSCLEASQFLETALGKKENESLTPEYHCVNEKQTLRQRET